jgi:hypothetical protein
VQELREQLRSLALSAVGERGACREGERREERLRIAGRAGELEATNRVDGSPGNLRVSET